MHMIFVVLYKYLNCAGDKTIDAGHTARTYCNYQSSDNTINVIYYFLEKIFENRPI